MTSSGDLPAALVANLAGVHGAEAVARWVRELPALVHDFAQTWRLDVGEPFADLSFTWVAPCRTAAGQDAVLKIWMPHHELLTEVAALDAYAGHGLVRLLAAEPARGGLLLERAQPGAKLTIVEDDTVATSFAAGVIRAIRRLPPPGHAFPQVSEWAARAFERLRSENGGTSGPVPAALLAFAEETYRELGAPSAGDVLLHGDLHHGNILSHGGGWLAIDPKGVIGPPEYEPGALLRNPRDIVDDPGGAAILRRRGAQLADELGFDRATVMRWAAAQLVLSVAWSLEGGDAAALRWLPLAEELRRPA
ncbi:MAG: phosphotransferase [Dehalococcoidia bacterium]|nr:phosphotransferase [Dehalococcoidia bacterium]